MEKYACSSEVRYVHVHIRKYSCTNLQTAVASTRVP